ncbi:hypothetical protein [Streptomyces montanisoli]|nr:hypothetical protein [Streptomyces montanisoli]
MTRESPGRAASAGLVVGVDSGGTKIAAATADAHGRLLRTVRLA